MRSPSAGWCAGSGPERVKISGRTLRMPGETCQTTKTAAGKPAGSAATMCCSASRPPAEAPMTTMSRFAMGKAKQTADLRCSPLAELVHDQDHALALLPAGDERRAGDAALDHLAAAVHRVDRHVLLLAAVGEAAANERPQLGHRQADVEVEERAA